MGILKHVKDMLGQVVCRAAKSLNKGSKDTMDTAPHHKTQAPFSAMLQCIQLRF